MQVVVDWFQTNLGFLPPQLLVTLVSMLPLIELRGGIPLARLLMLPLWQALLFSAIGNIFIEKIFDWLRPTKHFGGIVKKLEARALGKSDGIQKAEFLGLTLFVGIPLPGTGGWTGALIASLLKIDRKKASLAILLGIALASTIMSFISYGVFAM